jgi:hypothetical protein
VEGVGNETPRRIDVADPALCTHTLDVTTAAACKRVRCRRLEGVGNETPRRIGVAAKVPYDPESFQPGNAQRCHVPPLVCRLICGAVSP